MTEYFLDTTCHPKRDYEKGVDMNWQDWYSDEKSKPLKAVALKLLNKKEIKGVRIDKKSGREGQEEMTTSWVKFKV